MEGCVISSELEQIRSENEGSINVEEADKIINDFSQVLQSHLTGEEESKVHAKVELMTSQISTLKKEVYTVDAELMDQNFIPKIAEELRLVVKHTEESANKILDIFDEICGIVLQASPPTIKNDLMSKSTKILEACNFQDIIGQRIKNVTSNLISIESILLKVLKTFEIKNAPATVSADPDAHLLNGPPRGKASPSQKAIDDLFNSV